MHASLDIYDLVNFPIQNFMVMLASWEILTHLISDTLIAVYYV